MLTWSDRDSFVVGSRYLDSETGDVLTYLGSADLPALNGEYALVFTTPDEPGVLTVATLHGRLNGQTFTKTTG